MPKQEFNAIVTIVCVFVVALLFLSILNGAVTLFMVIGALAITYIFVHYWEKRYKIKQRSVNK